jgi:hypothetical protein
MAIVPSSNQDALLTEVNGLLDRQNISADFESELFPKPVSTLPTSGTIGETIYYKAAAGIYWHLLYTGEATYPWAKIGGPPLRGETSSGVETVNTTEVDAANVLLQLTMPLACNADIKVGSNRVIPPASAFSHVGLYVGGGKFAESYGGPGVQDSLSVTLRGTAAKGVVVENRYSRLGGAAGSSIGFLGLYTEVDPLRVG